MNKQLSLTKKQLEVIGFIKKQYPADKLNPAKTVYEIPCINGVFYCNPKEPVYKWYQKVIIGKAANFIHLDITSLPQLYTILQSFKIKFKIIIL